MLLSGLTPKISASAIIPTNAKIAVEIQENRGRYAGLLNASISHDPNRISVRIRNAKFFPVINGKNIVVLTIKAINGTRNMPPMSIYLNV